MTPHRTVVADPPDRRGVNVGDWIIERQHNAQPRLVESVTEGHYILARGAASGRLTRVSWPNLNRYRVLDPLEAPEQPRSAA